MGENISRPYGGSECDNFLENFTIKRTKEMGS